MKKQLRKEVLARRNTLPEEERTSKSEAIRQRLLALPFWHQARLVMIYVSFGSEVQTLELIRDALHQGKRLAVPFCRRDRRELIASEVLYFPEDLSPGAWGILEPREETLRPVRPQEIDLCLVPGVAFDVHGNRLGYGAGYYDGLLPRLRPEAWKIGLAFDIQIVPTTYPEEHDFPLDAVITESGLLGPFSPVKKLI
ncbi:MAG: 5-formyltetrahydrofolate cyclo-ligase [Moorellaceae bacterium]